MGTRNLLARIEALEKRLSARTTQLILALDQIAQLKSALVDHNLEITYGNETVEARGHHGPTEAG